MKRRVRHLCNWEACRYGAGCNGCGPLERLTSLSRMRPVCRVELQYDCKSVECFLYDCREPYPDTQPLMEESVKNLGEGMAIVKS